jgi:ribosome-binding protein aMBF1 (putative translation factor)
MSKGESNCAVCKKTFPQEELTLYVQGETTRQVCEDCAEKLPSDAEAQTIKEPKKKAHLEDFPIGARRKKLDT